MWMDGILIAVSAILLILGLVLRQQRPRQPEQSTWQAKRAWSVALLNSSLTVFLAWISGAFRCVVLSFSAYSGDALFIAMTILLFVYVLFLYWVVWSAYTLTFDRPLVILPAVALGFLWALSSPLVGVMIFYLVSSLSGWLDADGNSAGYAGVYLIVYGITSVYSSLFQGFYWSPLMPEHDSAAMFKKKVPMVHVPNITVTLVFPLIWPKATLFYLIAQALALIGAAVSMRAPSWYTTVPHRPHSTEPACCGLIQAAGYEEPAEGEGDAAGKPKPDARYNYQRGLLPFFCCRKKGETGSEVLFV